jgi:hypothetical protein
VFDPVVREEFRTPGVAGLRGGFEVFDFAGLIGAAGGYLAN